MSLEILLVIILFIIIIILNKLINYHNLWFSLDSNLNQSGYEISQQNKYNLIIIFYRVFPKVWGFLFVIKTD
ncbi:hypothetical protein BY996DRAFT_6959058, partial [Phakopsora pachyrhizi]